MKYQRTTTTIGATALALAALLSQQSANAALLAYEDFNYTAGTSFVGGAGGLGFSSAWLLNGGNNLNSIALAGSLNYNDGFGNDLVVSGNRGFTTGDGSATGDNLTGGTSAASQPLRPFSFNRGNDGSTVSTWISIMALRTGIPNPTPAASPNDYLYGRAAGVQFFYQATTATTAGNEQFTIGRGTQSSETAAFQNDTWGVLQQGNANAMKVSTVNMAATPADFILIRIDHIGSIVNDLVNADTLRMWINPRLDVAPLDALADVTLNANEFAAAPLSINRDLNFNKLRLFAGQAQTTPSGRSYGSEEVDELRVGETFADVTPFTTAIAPEPTVAALSGLGILALILKRRR